LLAYHPWGLRITQAGHNLLNYFHTSRYDANHYQDRSQEQEGDELAALISSVRHLCQFVVPILDTTAAVVNMRASSQCLTAQRDTPGGSSR